MPVREAHQLARFACSARARSTCGPLESMRDAGSAPNVACSRFANANDCYELPRTESSEVVSGLCVARGHAGAGPASKALGCAWPQGRRRQRGGTNLFWRFAVWQVVHAARLRWNRCMYVLEVLEVDHVPCG